MSGQLNRPVPAAGPHPAPLRAHRLGLRLQVHRPVLLSVALAPPVIGLVAEAFAGLALAAVIVLGAVWLSMRHTGVDVDAAT